MPSLCCALCGWQCKNTGIVGQEVTEQCFQNTPVKFVGQKQWVEYCTSTIQYPPYNAKPSAAFPACGGKDNPPTTSIKALDVSVGTVPAGSTCESTNDSVSAHT